MHKPAAVTSSPSALRSRSRATWRNRRLPAIEKIGMDSSFARRRELRRRSTDAAALLWSHLRGRRLAGFKFRRQHTCRPFLLDFFCPKLRLAIQLDSRKHLDLADDLLAARGITVLRFPSHQVLRETEAVLVAIAFALSTLRP
jgi:very-short-patch-repair endonuclease